MFSCSVVFNIYNPLRFSPLFLVHTRSTDSFYSVRSGISGFMYTVKLERSYLRSHTRSFLKASMQQRQTPCAHYLSITDQLLWSHSSRLQIRPVLVAYSSTISLWDAQTGPWAISPSGQSVKFTPQQVIVVDSGRQPLLWGKNSFWNTSWNSAFSAATGCRQFDTKRGSFKCCNLYVLLLLITI